MSNIDLIPGKLYKVTSIFGHPGFFGMFLGSENNSTLGCFLCGKYKKYVNFYCWEYEEVT